MVSQVRTIRVINVVKGEKDIQRLAKNYGQLNKGVKKTSDTLQLFRRAFQFAIAGVGIREIARAADQFQLLRDRITAFTGSRKIAREAFTDLAKAAKFTRTSIASLAQTYNRVALATTELGLSSKQIIGVTAALQQTFRLQGATIAEAAGATIQLTQGLSSGALRGQELRSVLEANGVIVDILGKELGITRGQIIKFAESGKITSQVVLRALANNIDEINKKAKALGTTFEQGITIALDNFRLRLDKVNEQLELSGKFNKALLFLTENFEKFAIVIGAFVSSKVIITLAAQINLLAKAASVGAFVQLLAKSNLLIAALAAAGVATVAFIENLKNPGKNVLIEEIDKTESEIKRLQKRVDVFGEQLRKAREVGNKNVESFLGKKVGDDIVRLESLRKKLSSLQTQLGSIKEEDFGKEISNAVKSINVESGNASKTLAFFNSQLNSNVITLDQYDQAITRLKLTELNKKFKEGKVDIDQYNSALLKLNTNLDDTNRISLGAQDGLRKVASTAGNVGLQISNAFVGAFKTLEDTIFEFVKTSEFTFSKFAQAVLDELTRVIIRTQLIANVARAVNLGIGALTAGGGASGGGGAGGGAGGGTATAGGFRSANGNIFNNGDVVPFANGGIVGSSTLFPLTGGKTGLMGEAGPEAIMPLVRRNGRLGVEGGSNVQVNIINNSSSEVEARESEGPNGERIMDFLIKAKVNEAIANGSFDKNLGENFGLRRRGS